MYSIHHSSCLHLSLQHIPKIHILTICYVLQSMAVVRRAVLSIPPRILTAQIPAAKDGDEHDRCSRNNAGDEAALIDRAGRRREADRAYHVADAVADKGRCVC